MSSLLRDHHAGDNESIQSTLARALLSGELMIVLGAGASASVGLPGWLGLVNSCVEHANKNLKGKGKKIELATKNASTEDLMIKMTAVKACFSNSEYTEIVQKCLYEKIDKDVGYSDLLKEDLLISLGSLLMGSYRGNVNEVITYNFDDVLEWYLQLHGYITQIVVDPLSLVKKSDVRIYHPHGFLPFYDEYFNNHHSLVFDKTSYDDRLGGKNSPWPKRLELLLSTKTALFIGFSGKDPTFGPMLRSIAKSQDSRELICYFIRSEADEPLLEEDELDKDRKIMPIYLEKHSDIPPFLLGISQIAANDLRNQL